MPNNLMPIEILVAGAEQLNLELSARQVAQFDRYLDLLISWNQSINLTAVREPQEIVSRHFLDSLTCLVVTGDLNDDRLIDVGTGAGFPGLPLKITNPGLQLVLLESVRKKALFLQTVIDDLGIDGVRVINQRAEDLGKDPDHREKYDWSTARAVSRLRILVEYLLPFCKVGGKALAQKGENAALEVTEALEGIQILGGEKPALISGFPLNDSGRSTLVVINKIGNTPEKYPRRAGVPGKRPL